MKIFLAKHAVALWAALAVVVVIGVPVGVYVLWHMQRGPAAVSATPVQPAPAVINATGTIIAAKTIYLSSAASGTVSTLNVGVGSRVSVGEVLLTLGTTSINSQLSSAKSALKSAQSKLDSLSKLPTVTTSTVTVGGPTASQTAALAQAQSSVRTTVRNSSINADDVIHTKVDQFFKNVSGSNPQLSFVLADENLLNTVNSERANVGTILAAWDKEVAASSFNTTTNTATLATNAESNVNTINTFLNNVNTALNEARSQNSISASTFSSYESALASGRLTMSNASNSLLTAESQEQVARAAIAASVTQQVTTTTIASTTKAVASEKATVNTDQAKVSALEAQLTAAEKGTITAPVAGTITAVSVRSGSVIKARTVLIAMIASGTDMQIQSFIPASTTAEINIGNEVQFSVGTSTSVFPATILEINPATISGDPAVVISQITTTTTAFKVGEAVDLAISGNAP